MLFTKETLKSYAASKGITQIDDSAFQILSQDLEYRVKELIQESAKYMYASRRTKLSIDDINYALESRNIDPLFGYDPNEPLNFKSLSNFYYTPDEEIDLEEFLNKPLPKIPLKPVIQAYWLAIEGVTPLIPENIVQDTKLESSNALKNYVEDTDIKATTKHVLTKELQLYYDKIKNFIIGNDDERKMALECLENDSGIQQLIPYFIHTFYEEIVAKSDFLQSSVRMLFAIIMNKFIFVDPYLHQITPALFSALYGNCVNEESKIVACDAIVYIYEKFSITYGNLGPRILAILNENLTNEGKDEVAQYYSLLCISRLNENAKENFRANYGGKIVVNAKSERVRTLLELILSNNE